MKYLSKIIFIHLIFVAKVRDYIIDVSVFKRLVIEWYISYTRIALFIKYLKVNLGYCQLNKRNR